MAEVYSISERNHQSEPPERKPNEDFCGYLSDDRIIAASVMDGIPVLRNPDLSYPVKNGLIAARIAVERTLDVLKVGDPSKLTMTEAFRAANQIIKEANERERIYKQSPPWWLATVGCSLVVDFSNSRAFFGYIGDPFGFAVYPEETRLLTQDQLCYFEEHLFRKHRDIAKDPGSNRFIREYQDSEVRNRVDAVCWCGAEIKGWGALTGEEEAMRFVETVALPVFPGRTRFILASDAIAALGVGKGLERRAEDYQSAISAVNGFTV